MKFRVVQFSVVAARAHRLSLVKRGYPGVARHPGVGFNVGARPLCAVWQLDPQTERLEMRWTAGRARA